LNRALQTATIVLVIGFIALYVAAKVHFFTRFTGDMSAYWAEHWPYSAGLAFVAAMLWMIGRLAKKGARP
jgi:hypothetical protein